MFKVLASNFIECVTRRNIVNVFPYCEHTNTTLDQIIIFFLFTLNTAWGSIHPPKQGRVTEMENLK